MCNKLKEELVDAKINFLETQNYKRLMDLGIMAIPVLELPNGSFYTYDDAIRYIRKYRKDNQQ
jgi:hypothetical protein